MTFDGLQVKKFTCRSPSMPVPWKLLRELIEAVQRSAAFHSAPRRLSDTSTAGGVVALVRLGHDEPGIGGDSEVTIGLEAAGWNVEQQIDRSSRGDGRRGLRR